MNRYKLEFEQTGDLTYTLEMIASRYGDWVNVDEAKDLESRLVDYEKEIADLQEEVEELNSLYQNALNEIERLELLRDEDIE